PERTDRPDPENYAKLNSKEKRQLRNKISARNFRHRRKEYITTLEEEISSRDTIISQLRDEVGVMRVENKDLHGEVTMLKAKWEEMMEKMTSFQAPSPSVGLGLNTGRLVPSSIASPSTPADDIWALDSPKASTSQLPPLPIASTAPTSAIVTRKRAKNNDIAKPNLSKDVAPGLKRSTGSWTTAQGMGGGYMPVHTTCVPFLPFTTTSKPYLRTLPFYRFLPEFSLGMKPTLSPFATQSFNPALNNLTSSQLGQLPSLTSHLRNGYTSPPADATTPSPSASRTGTFEPFFESNPYWLRPDNVEEYRSQLYGKVAHNMAGTAASHKASGTSSSSASSNGSPDSTNQHLPIPAGFRPAFFTSPAAGLSGNKESRRDAFSSSSDLLAFQSPREVQRQQDQHTAFVAGLAAQTLFSRMASAFVEAFAGSAGEGGKNGMMSGEKVASVLSGRSSLKVVENDDVGALVGRMGAVKIEESVGGAGAGACGFEAVVRQAWGGKQSKEEGARPKTPSA
ncbi:bZIP-type transcription factor MBZ1, partial [Phenoliferia sp. Uapishka_3]